MFTIIIFTSNREKEFLELYNDILINNLNVNNKAEIIIVSYENSTLVNKKLKKIINKKFFKFFIEKKKLTLKEKLKKYFLKAKNNYIWWIADDDRICKDSFNKINHIFKYNKNISGLTLNFLPLKFISQSFYSDKNSAVLMEDLNLKKDLANLGMNSTQIVRKNYFKECVQLIEDKNINKDYYYLGIILKIISKYKNWKKINNKLVVYRLNNYKYNNEQKLNRLNSEFEGYLIPIKKFFNKSQYNEYFYQVFFKNIISWIVYNINYNKKKKTFAVILQNKKFIPKKIIIIFILILLYIAPVSCLNFLKKFYSKYFK